MRHPVIFRWHSSAALAAGILLAACSGPKNYSEAQVRQVGGSHFVLLKGRRVLMVHDPISALLRETYEDSVLLPLPVGDGTLLGKDIPTEPGYYTYGGEIRRDGEKLTVNLSFNNTDDSLTYPVDWNGEYKLIGR